jgi:hypothetical protein
VGLARTRPGQHQHRPLDVFHGLALLGVERIEEELEMWSEKHDSIADFGFRIGDWGRFRVISLEY